MDLSKIISVAGKSGLYRIVAQGRQAIIAESLEDGKRVPVHASLKVSSLDDISMFTTGDDVPLRDVLAKLHEVEKGGASLDPKGNEEALWKKLGEALPTNDRSRIYVSDVRKLFTWYAQLLKSGVFSAKEEAVKSAEGEKGGKGEKKGAKTKAKVEGGAKKAGAPKPGTKTKSAGTTLRKSSQRGS